jgi:hypothetical protein
VAVFGDFLADQRVQVGEFLIQGDDFLCECGDDQFPEVLRRDGGVLGFRGVDGGLGDGGGRAGAVFFSHACSRAWPVRRIPSGVRCLVSNSRAALERL